MPVAAKFSKEFYEKLGHNVADELVEWFNQVDATYRSEFRELFEAHFGRLDAKLDHRLSELKAELIKWMFVFWAGTMALLLGTVVALLKL